MQKLFQQLWEIEYRILKFQINIRWDTWELKNLVLEKEKVLNKIKLKELEKDIKKI